jgi:hypothetical protein
MCSVVFCKSCVVLFRFTIALSVLRFMDSGFTIDIFKLFFEKRVIGVIVINVRKYVFFMSLANHKFTNLGLIAMRHMH